MISVGSLSVDLVGGTDAFSKGMRSVDEVLAHVEQSAKAAEAATGGVVAATNRAAASAQESAKEIAGLNEELDHKPQGLLGSLKEVGDEAHKAGRFMRRAMGAQVILMESQQIAQRLQSLGTEFGAVAGTAVTAAASIGQAFIHGGPIGAGLAAAAQGVELLIGLYKESAEAAKKAADATIGGFEKAAEAAGQAAAVLNQARMQRDAADEAHAKGITPEAALANAHMVSLNDQFQAISAQRDTQARVVELSSQHAGANDAGTYQHTNLLTEQGKLGELDQQLKELESKFFAVGEAAGVAAKAAQQALVLHDFGRSLQLVGQAANGPDKALAELAAKTAELNGEFKKSAPATQGLRDSMTDLHLALTKARESAASMAAIIDANAEREFRLRQIAEKQADDVDRGHPLADKAARARTEAFKNSQEGVQRSSQGADADADEANDAWLASLKKALDAAQMTDVPLSEATQKMLDDAAAALSQGAEAAGKNGAGAQVQAAVQGVAGDKATAQQSAEDGMSVDKVVDMLGGANSPLGRIASMFGGDDSKALKEHDSTLGSAAGKLGFDRLGKVIDEIADVVSRVSDAIVSAAESMLPSTSEIMQHTVAGGKITTIMDNLSRTVMPALNKAIEPFLPGIYAFAQGVGQVVTAIANFVSKYAEPLSHLVYEIVSDLGSVWNAIVGALSGIIGWIASALETIHLDSAAKAVQAVADGVKSAEVTIPSYDNAAKAIDKMTAATDAATASLTNVPSGYKVALATFGAMSSSANDVAGPQNPGAASRGVVNNFFGKVDVQANDATKFATQMQAEAKKRAALLGTTIPSSPPLSGN